MSGVDAQSRKRHGGFSILAAENRRSAIDPEADVPVTPAKAGAQSLIGQCAPPHPILRRDDERWQQIHPLPALRQLQPHPWKLPSPPGQQCLLSYPACCWQSGAMIVRPSPYPFLRAAGVAGRAGSRVAQPGGRVFGFRTVSHVSPTFRNP